MDRSKEEMQKRLTALKKELATKEKKLERSRHVSNRRAHVRQKVNELNEQEQQDYKQKHQTLEENIPLRTSVPLRASKFSSDICQLVPTNLVSKANVDNMPVLSATDICLNTNVTVKDCNVDGNLMPKKPEKFKDGKMTELINENVAKSNSLSHAESDTSIKGKNFIINTMLNKNAASKIRNKSEIKMCTFESKNDHTKYNIQVKTSSDYTNKKQEKFESTLQLSNRIGGADSECLQKSIDKTEAESRHREEVFSSDPNTEVISRDLNTEFISSYPNTEGVISSDPNTEEIIVETQQCLTYMNSKNKTLIINNEPVEKSTACNWFSDFSTASKKTENEKNDPLLYHTSSMSDFEFLQILGVTQTKSVERAHQTNTNVKTRLPSAEESTLVLSSSLPTPEHITTIKKVIQPRLDKVSPSTKDQQLFLDYTELDAIPFTKFELEEDFLSEVSQYTQPHGSCTKHQVGNSFRAGPLIKRRSSRISEINLHSPLKSSQNKQNFTAGYKRRLSEQEKVVSIRSIFQFLKEEAIKPKWSSEFDLPELFQNLQKLKQINSSSFCSQNTLVSTKEIKCAGVSSVCIRKLDDFEVNVCESQKQLFKTSSEPVLNMSNSGENRSTFLNNEVENHKVDLVLDKEIKSSKPLDNTVTNVKLQNHTQSPRHLSLTNETYTRRIDVFTSPPSPIAHVMTEDKTSLHEASVHVDYCKTDTVLMALGSVIENINPPSNQELQDLKAPCPLLTTSTPKAVKIQSFLPKMSLDDTLEKSAILFEEESQQDNPVTPSCPGTELLEKNVFKSCDSPSLENNLDWNGQIACSHHIKKPKRDSSPGICSSPSHSMIHLSHTSSVGYSPIQLIQPWKKLERTPQTPLQILEDKRNENDQSPLVYIPARRLSRSQLTETKPKTLKFSGCFQSCCQDAVISILCGSLLTQHKDLVQYLVSVQATSLTVWTKDDYLEWTTELEWRLPPENHLIQAQLLPVTDRIVIITCGWDGGLLFVSLFLYDSQTEDTKRFNVQVSEFSNGVRSPTNAIIETVSTTEIMLGVTNDTLHILGKIDFSADLCKEKTTCFPKQRGQLLGITTVTGQETTCISLSSSQNITIWNTCYGIAIKSIQLPVHVPCLIKLLKAKNYQGIILLEALWKVEQGCGGLLIINPINNQIKMWKTYCVPNSTWKSTHSAKIEMGLVAAISNTGSFCLWQSKSGKLVCHAKSHTTTALSVMKSDQSLLVGEIQGCLHLYKLAL